MTALELDESIDDHRRDLGLPVTDPLTRPGPGPGRHGPARVPRSRTEGGTPHVDAGERPPDRDRPRRWSSATPASWWTGWLRATSRSSGSPRPPSARPGSLPRCSAAEPSAWVTPGSRTSLACRRGRVGATHPDPLPHGQPGGTGGPHRDRQPQHRARRPRRARRRRGARRDPPRRDPDGRARRPPRRHRRRRRGGRGEGRAGVTVAPAARPRDQPGLPERSRARRREHGRAAPARRPDRGAPPHHPRRRLRRQLRQPGLGADDGRGSDAPTSCASARRSCSAPSPSAARRSPA